MDKSISVFVSVFAIAVAMFLVFTASTDLYIAYDSSAVVVVPTTTQSTRIFGVPPSIILTNLQNQVNKTNNLQIQAILTFIRPRAEVIYQTYGNYNRVCGRTGQPQDPEIKNTIDSLKNLTGTTTLGTNVSAGIVCASGVPIGNATSFAIFSPAFPVNGSTNIGYCTDPSNSVKEMSAGISAVSVDCTPWIKFPHVTVTGPTNGSVVIKNPVVTTGTFVLIATYLPITFDTYDFAGAVTITRAEVYINNAKVADLTGPIPQFSNATKNTYFTLWPIPATTTGNQSLYVKIYSANGASSQSSTVNFTIQ